MNKDNHRFKDRAIHQHISPEFIRHSTDLHNESKIRDRLEYAARRLERSYSVVAMVDENDEFYGETGYQITAIPTMDADRDEISHGIQSIVYWVSEGSNE